jgi:ribosomal protein L11 methyltransferase
MLAPAMLEGLAPNSAEHVMRLVCDQATACSIADMVFETLDPATTAAAAFEEEANASGASNGRWVVEIYFGAPPDEGVIRALISTVASDALAQAAIFGSIDERDWVATSLAELKPVRAGRFLIHGAHGRCAAKPNDIAIEIEAALAFGTGHHGSTRGCLLLLDLLARKRIPRAILDLGTGSGILAIAAAKLFRRAVQAGDIDPVSVKVATANAKRNGAGKFVRPVLAKGTAHPLLRKGAPYDLVLANILARPLQGLAQSIASLATSGADIVLSGLIAQDVAGVTAAYRMQRIAVCRRIDIDGWVTLLMRRRAYSVLIRANPRRRRAVVRLRNPATSNPNTTTA